MRLASSTFRRAAFGVGPVAALKAVSRVLRRGPTDIAGSVIPPSGNHPLDAAYGTDTGGFRSWRELQSGAANDPYISGYLGVSPSVARPLLSVVTDCADYTFIDLGCGKGRALILASEFPFRRIVGVEIAPELAAHARNNGETISAAYPERTRIDVAHADAAAFVFPPGPLVLFLFQPFEMPVMRAVQRQFAASLAQEPRGAVVIYIHPVHRRVFDRMEQLEPVASGTLVPSEQDRPFTYGGRGGEEDYTIWRTRDPAPALRPVEPITAAAPPYSP
jgi:SAM-dependent methyltransferase